jgi:hypothetical protein
MAYPVTAFASVEGEPNCRSQVFISLIPLITPVSYPKRIPPNALKAVVCGGMRNGFQYHYKMKFLTGHGNSCEFVLRNVSRGFNDGSDGVATLEPPAPIT